jgi:hypothetical protein
MRNHLGTKAFAALMLLGLVTAGTAQDKSPGGSSEGIKVHGHWTIEVRNPDGSLASHSEFENSLVQDRGDEVLAGVLSNRFTVGSWTLWLSDGSLEGRGPCAGQYACVASGLGMQLIGTGALQLSATFTATDDSVIRKVLTEAVPSDGRFPVPFTARELGLTEEKQVVAGQIIQITVVYSFS